MLRNFTRQCSASSALRQAICKQSVTVSRPAITSITPRASTPRRLQPSSSSHRAFQTIASRRKQQSPPGERPPTNFNDLDVLGNAAVPSTSVDVCMYDGFGLNSGVTITDGNGVLLIDGEVFRWRPWEAKGSLNLVNKKGQLELPAEAFSLFNLLWPRPGARSPSVQSSPQGSTQKAKLTLCRYPHNWRRQVNRSAQSRDEETRLQPRHTS